MREFALGFANGTVSANTVVGARAPAAPSCNLEFLRAWLGQSGSTTSGQCRVQHTRQISGFPTLVGATPVPLKEQDQASRLVSSTNGSAGTCGTLASAEGAGAKTVLWEDDFNNLNGYLWVPTPAEKRVNPAGSLSVEGLYLPAQPTSNVNWSGGLIYAEV